MNLNKMASLIYWRKFIVYIIKSKIVNRLFDRKFLFMFSFCVSGTVFFFFMVYATPLRKEIIMLQRTKIVQTFVTFIDFLFQQDNAPV